MEPVQLEVLLNSKLPRDRLYRAPLEWMAIRANRAMDEGTLAGDNATKGIILRQVVDIRDKQRAITDKIERRMPLAYVNFVQILVDTSVFTAPIALYGKLGDFSILAVGILTIFYCGLNNLAKIFVSTSLLSLLLLAYLDDINFTHHFPYTARPSK